MALYMFFYAVPDEHLEFLRDNPTLFDAYLAGELPELKQGFLSRILGKEPPELPGDWPDHALEAWSSEINHRQVKAFHYILNGQSELVDDVGCVFQTWLKPRHTSPAIVIDGENFSFSCSNTRLLLEMLEGLTPELMGDRLRESGQEKEIPGGASFVEAAFEEFVSVCQRAISKGQGVLWSSR